MTLRPQAGGHISVLQWFRWERIAGSQVVWPPGIPSMVLQAYWPVGSQLNRVVFSRRNELNVIFESNQSLTITWLLSLIFSNLTHLYSDFPQFDFHPKIPLGSIFVVRQTGQFPAPHRWCTLFRALFYQAGASVTVPAPALPGPLGGRFDGVALTLTLDLTSPHQPTNCSRFRFLVQSI